MQNTQAHKAVMATAQNAQRPGEFKLRPLPTKERADQRDVSRVFLTPEVFMDLKLVNGHVCEFWKADDPEGPKRKGIAWASNSKQSYQVINMFKTFQSVSGFKLEDKLCIVPGGPPPLVEIVNVKDITNEIPNAEHVTPLSEKDRPHWEWHLEDFFARAEHVFPGMLIKDLMPRREKRTFVVDSINNGSTTIARFDPTSTAKIGTDFQVVDGVPNTAALEVKGIAGIDAQLEKLNRFLSKFGEEKIRPSGYPQKGAVILHGAPGTGKTMIMSKISNTGWGKVFEVNNRTKPADVRQVFREARLQQPSIVVIDELDSIISKDIPKHMSIEKDLGEELDGLYTGHLVPQRVVVVATTSELSEIPRGLRKMGRFTTVIDLPVPDTNARKEILRSLEPASILSSDLIERLSDRTHAYVGGDLQMLICEARTIAEDRPGTEDYEDGCPLTQEDADQALLVVRPSAMRDVILEPPKVKWDEIGGQDEVKKALRRVVEQPLSKAERMQRLGMAPTKGLLLYGPPGCSKTLSAQAMATEASFNFFAVKGAELLNMYVGESERAVRNVFARARAAAPSIIFFDEIESIGSKRESGSRSSGLNVLTTLLNEMDGIESLKGVTVLAATNKPEALDLALLRPGRFDDLLYVAPPDEKGREEILHVKKKKMDFAEDVDIKELARLTEGYSGAELVRICQEASKIADEKCDERGEELPILMEFFVQAKEKIRPQITPEIVEGYKRWAAGFGSTEDDIAV